MNEVRNIIVGFELGETASQLCYYDRSEKEPVSLAVKAGTSQHTFPTYLSKKPGEESYHYGMEAEYFASHQDEILIQNLYECCLLTKEIEVDDRMVKPANLLTEFFRQALSMLGINNPVKNISGIMVTVPRLNKAFVDNMRTAFSMLGFPEVRCFLQDYDESFYYYALSQKPDFWSRKVGLFSFDREEVDFQSLSIDRQPKPALASIQRGKRIELDTVPEQRDLQFYELIQDSLGNDIYSSIFLIGNGFDKNWAVRSIPLLCKNQRHVFYGNNLYSKGACYAALEKVEERRLRDYLYLGEDLVLTGIGMELLVSGVQSYYPLVEPGIHWYEAVKDCEILLEDARELIFLVGKMKTNEMKRYCMKLPGLPDRPRKATRLQLHLEYESPKQCTIRVTDLGLGELFPASGLEWNEVVTG